VNNYTIIVKNISNLSEARYCAGMMVDFISFELDDFSENFLSLDKYFEIKNWLSGVKILGNSDSNDVLFLNSAIEERKLDGFIFNENQLDIFEEIDCEIKILEIGMEKYNNIFPKIKALPDYLLIHGEIDEEKIVSTESPKCLIGFAASNVKIKSEQISGYAFLGGKEIRPGYGVDKNLMEALEYLEEEL
jgi:phosphoribosylanthranilate isomerase